MSRKTMSLELKMAVYSRLPKKPDGTTASVLSNSIGLTERTVRRVIADLREEGHLIVNLQDGKGFYVLDECTEDTEPEALDLIARQYRQDTNRAMNILKRRKHMRKLLKSAGREV